MTLSNEMKLALESAGSSVIEFDAESVGIFDSIACDDAFSESNENGVGTCPELESIASEVELSGAMSV
jgi:hypothetical protein